MKKFLRKSTEEIERTFDYLLFSFWAVVLHQAFSLIFFLLSKEVRP